MSFPGSLDSVNQVVLLEVGGLYSTNRPQFKLDLHYFLNVPFAWHEAIQKPWYAVACKKKQTIIFWTDNLAALLSNLGLPSLLEGKKCCCLLSNLPQLHSSQLGQNDIPAPGRYDMKTVLEKCAVRMSSGISTMILQGSFDCPFWGNQTILYVW